MANNIRIKGIVVGYCSTDKLRVLWRYPKDKTNVVKLTCTNESLNSLQICHERIVDLAQIIKEV